MLEKLMAALTSATPEERRREVNQTIRGKILRFGFGAYGSEIGRSYTALVDGHPHPLQIYPTKVGSPRYLELTSPGDFVTVCLAENGEVLSFVNPSLPK